MAINLGSDYNGATIENLHTRVSTILQNLSEVRSRFNTIVCTGISGLLVAPSVAKDLNKNLIVIRKPDDTNHHAVEYDTPLTFMAEGRLPSICNWLFLDDMICSGNTFYRVLKCMEELRQTHFIDHPHCKMNFVGAYAHARSLFMERDMLRVRLLPGIAEKIDIHNLL